MSMTKDERADFRGYLRQCTDAQVQGVYDKERRAGREEETELAEAEAERRGITLQRNHGPGPAPTCPHGLGYRCRTCYAQPGEVPYLSPYR